MKILCIVTDVVALIAELVMNKMYKILMNLCATNVERTSVKLCKK